MKVNEVAMKAFLAIVAFLIPFLLHSTLSINSSGLIDVNDIQFRLTPEVTVKTAPNDFHNITFTEHITTYADSFRIEYSATELDLNICLTPQALFPTQGWKAVLKADYKADLQIKDIALKLDFVNPSGIIAYKGIKAINSRSPEDSINLCPYTDKAIEFQGLNSSCWIIGSNYAGCKGIEGITENSIRFYDHTLHYTKLSNYQSYTTDKLMDTMPRTYGQSDIWSFLLFGEKPYLFSINRWAGDKKAALAITNDADGETEMKLSSAFFGSSNSNSSNYLAKGLIANHIKISNTVFGANINTLGSVWNSLLPYGNTIGYHTYSDQADSTSVISNSLLNDMSPYNVRLWVDHSLPYNPEDFGCYGTIGTSPFYVLDVINQSNIDYVWLGESPVSNPFNAFDEPWRLPHRLPFLTSLTKPVWFFGRTRMETWEYFNNYSIYDMKHNLTSENLDQLLLSNGLCVGYTHFSFTNNSTRQGFYLVTPEGSCEVIDEAEQAFQMLNTYQNERGLWIDTVENIFDRMLAIEEVEIESIDIASNPGFIKVLVRNNSEYDLDNLNIRYFNDSDIIPFLPAHGLGEYFFVRTDFPPNPDITPAYLVYYVSEAIYLKSRTELKIPPLSVEIYNLKGQKVKEFVQPAQSDYLVIPFQSKASGIYFAKISARNSKPVVVRFTVIK
jgi:hypothetical protein